MIKACTPAAIGVVIDKVAPATVAVMIATGLIPAFTETIAAIGIVRLITGMLPINCVIKNGMVKKRLTRTYSLVVLPVKTVRTRAIQSAAPVFVNAFA